MMFDLNIVLFYTGFNHNEVAKVSTERPFVFQVLWKLTPMELAIKKRCVIIT